VADKGGVIGINAFPGFVARPKSTIHDYLDHLDYVVKLVGEDHVGLGPDFLDWEKESVIPYAEDLIRNHPEVFGNTVDFPEGLKDPTDCPNITRGLVARGYTDEAIEKILGGNFLRVFGEIF
jgi:membrane dipeptidase